MKSKQKVLSAFLLAMINVSAICSIRNWPVAAEYGFASLFIILVSALIFFIPVALVSAELATGWPEEGGVFAWVKEAFGHKFGFLSIWYLWLTNIPWYPTLLSFIAATLAFVFNPALVHSKIYMLSMILILFWAATLLNLKGMKISGWISSIGVIAGTLIPGVVIIALGMGYSASGHPLEINISWNSFLPKITEVNQLALITGILFSFTGIEMSAVHAKEVLSPQKNFPKAIFLSALIIFLISALGTLAIAFVIPSGQISFISGSLDTLTVFFNAYNLGVLIPFISFSIAIGAFGQMSTWIAGPSKGLLAAAKFGDLPPALRQTNDQGMPTALMILQGIIVSFLALLFLFMPSVTSSFWILTALTAQFYLLLYIIMFAAAIYLSFKKAHVPRHYRVPGGKIGMSLIAGIGLITSLAGFLIGFIPPAQFQTGSIFFYEAFLITGIVFGSVMPSLFLKISKKNSPLNEKSGLPTV